MLSGEGNENGEKTTIVLISQKATLHVQHTFLNIFLPLFCKTTMRNFQKLPGYTLASLARRLLSLFLCVSLSLYSKFVDMTFNLSLLL